MRKFWIAFFAVCSLTFASMNRVTAASAVVYRVTLDPAGPGARVEGVLKLDGIFFKGWTGTSWLGERAKIEMVPEEKSIRFRYTVKFEQNQLFKAADPVINAEMAYAFLDHLLVGPVLDRPVDQYGVEVVAPAGWQVISSLGKYTAPLVFDSYDQMAGIALGAGNYTVLEWPFPNGNDAGVTGVTLAIQGPRTWSDATYFQDMKKIIQTQTEYFGGTHPARHLAVFLHVMNEHRGAGVSAFNRWAPGAVDTIIAVHEPARPWGHFEFFGMLSHEHLHNWYPNAMRSDLGPWFVEGLNDYVAYDILRTSGIHTPDNTLGMFNKWYYEYCWCVDGRRMELMPYRRGMIAAWVFDLEIQKATDRRMGLRDVLLGLFRSHPADGVVSKEDFLEQLQRVSGRDLSALYDILVEKDEKIDLPKFLEGSIFRYDAGLRRIEMAEPNP